MADRTRTTRSSQLGHLPNWTGPARRMAELIARSIQLGHPPNWTGPAWRMAELVARSIQLRYPPNRTGPARRMAELVARSIQLGHPLTRTGPARRMAELVMRLIQLGGWPSWLCVRSSSAIRRAGRVFDPARPSVVLDCLFFSSGVLLSLKLMLERFYRECVKKVSARKYDFRH